MPLDEIVVDEKLSSRIYVYCRAAQCETNDSQEQRSVKPETCCPLGNSREMQTPSSDTETGTFSLRRHRCCLKVNLVKEEDRPRTVGGAMWSTTRGGQRSKRFSGAYWRPWDTEEVIPVITIENPDTRSLSLLASRRSTGAPCEMAILYVCESGDHQTRMHLGGLQPSRVRAGVFSLFPFCEKRECLSHFEGPPRRPFLA